MRLLFSLLAAWSIVLLTACGGSTTDWPSDSVSSSSSSSTSSSSSSGSNSSSSSSSSGDQSNSPVVPDKFVGSTTTNGALRDDFIQYWNQISPDYFGRWRDIENVRNSYNWDALDRIYEYARRHGIPVKAVGLLWGSQTPPWMLQLSPAQQRLEVEEWIHDFCARYPDTALIEVVKEAQPGHIPPSYLAAAFGADWMIEVFKLAREHCRNAVLIYDDYNFLTFETEEILDLIRPAVEAGVVDALSMQARGLYSPRIWSEDEIRENLELIASLGTDLYISEYEINVADDSLQLQYMRMHFPIFYEHPQVAGITLWGYIYGSTWLPHSGLIRNGTPRPAMNWLLNYLSK